MATSMMATKVSTFEVSSKWGDYNSKAGISFKPKTNLGHTSLKN
jgi:hypothetical protein